MSDERHVAVSDQELTDDMPVRSLDEVLEKLPVGWFHYRLLIICGLSFMADGMEVSLLSFISTCAGIDWDLNGTQIALITSVVFAGELLGSIFFGPVADSGISPNYISLVVLRGIVGFGVGGVTVPFDLLAEFLPNSHRGRFLIYIEGFWTLGSMFVAGVAWLALSSEGWRVLTLITALPVAVSSFACIAYLPESPRWLVTQGRPEEAAEVVRYAAAVNGYHIPDFKLDSNIEKEEHVPLSEFLKPDQIKLSIPLWTVWACFGFTYYGVILYISRVFQSDDNHENECNFDYQAIFFSAMSEVAGVAITALMIDPWGRVGTQAALYAGAGTAVFCLGLPIPNITLKVVAIFARMTIMGANSATWVATPELFPTTLRASGHALANCMARIGAFFSPFLVEEKKVSVFSIGLTLGMVNAIACCSTLFLPETAGKELNDKNFEAKAKDNAVKNIVRANQRLQSPDDCYGQHLLNQEHSSDDYEEDARL